MTLSRLTEVGMTLSRPTWRYKINWTYRGVIMTLSRLTEVGVTF